MEFLAWKIMNFYNDLLNKETSSITNKTNVFRKPNKKEYEHEMNIEINRKINAGVVKYNNKYLAPFDKTVCMFRWIIKWIPN